MAGSIVSSQLQEESQSCSFRNSWYTVHEMMVFSSVVLRRLIKAEHRLIKITEEHHLTCHLTHGKSKDWRKCWNPVCVEARKVLGEEVTKALIYRHEAQRLAKRNKKKKKK